MSDEQKRDAKTGRRIVETRKFSGATADRKAPEEIKPKPVDDEVDWGGTYHEERAYLYEIFSNLRAPKEGDYPAVGVFNPGWLRIANYAWDAGVRRHEDLEVKRWYPSAGMAKRISELDEGVYITRTDANEEWPKFEPLEHIDPSQIKIERINSTTFRASHEPTGHSAEGKSRIKANQALLAKLEEIEEGAGDDPKVP